VPVPEKVKPERESVVDLALFGNAIWLVTIPGPSIRPARSSRFGYFNFIIPEASEELAARFPLPPPHLPVALKGCKHLIDENDSLPGCADRVGDHPAPAAQITHPARGCQGRSSI